MMGLETMGYTEKNECVLKIEKKLFLLPTFSFRVWLRRCSATNLSPASSSDEECDMETGNFKASS